MAGFRLAAGRGAALAANFPLRRPQLRSFACTSAFALSWSLDRFATWTTRAELPAVHILPQDKLTSLI